jgi:hypothetical protein
MIVDIFLWLTGWIISLFGMTPNWIVWPDVFLNAVQSSAGTIASFNFVFAISDLFTCINIFIWYFTLYIPFKLLVMFVNWMRGSGSIDI